MPFVFKGSSNGTRWWATSIFCSSVATPQRGQQWRHGCGANASYFHYFARNHPLNWRPKKGNHTAHKPPIHLTRRTVKVQAAAARRATKWKMSASAKMNLPHVAIYYANIINIIYSLCEKLKKKNFALGSRFFFWVGGRRSNEVATSPLGVTVTSIIPSSFVLFTLPLTVGVMLLAGSSRRSFSCNCRHVSTLNGHKMANKTGKSKATCPHQRRTFLIYGHFSVGSYALCNS